MSVTIKFRRGTATQWTTNGSTVLASGEPGYEVDTGRLKIGNGLTAWSGLSYSSIIPSGLLAGSGININLGTNGATATISVSGLNSTYISDFNEAVDDRIGSGLFVAGTGINLSYDDIGNSFTVSVTGLINNPTNNRILTSRDNTTTGIDAENNLTFNGSLLGVSGDLIANTGTLSILQFNTNNGAVSSQGQIGWNTTQGTVDLALTNTATIEVGEHQMYRVRNTTSNTLYRGQPVYASGVHANGIITPNLYVSDGSIDEIRFIGLVYENINNNNNGYVVAFGHMYNIDTRGNVASNIAVGDETWADGDILYPHPTVAGKLTKVPPKHYIPIALILDAASNGKLYVRRDLGAGELDDLHDVDVSGVTNGQFLQYNSATDYWVASSSGNFTTLLVNGTGVSISGHTHTASQITDFNEAVDDRVGSGLFVAGTGINLTYNDAGNSFTVSVTGLVNNPTNNRILTSRDSTTTGIDAESNLTFDSVTRNFTVGPHANSGSTSTIAGGSNNTILSGGGQFIGCGLNNSLGGAGYSVIVGGIGNVVASGGSLFNFIGGGLSNNIRAGDRSFIGGGASIAISGNDNTIVGGGGHLASGIFNFIGGGSTNRIINSAQYAVIPGGLSNLIQTSGLYSSIVGGSGNTINTNFSTIVGGVSNTANHNNVFILGSNITSTQADTTYVQNLDVASTGDIDTLKINKFYHNNLSVATGVADSDLLITIVDPTGTSSTQVISGSGLRNSLLNQPAALRFRQGTNSERLLITPASGEPIWTTDTQKFYIGDGSTVGGDFVGPSPYERSVGTQSISALNTGCVASGDYSVVGGGKYNTSSGYGSVVAGGGWFNSYANEAEGNTATGNLSSIGGGAKNIITASYSTICGGRNNTCSSYLGVIGGGFGNTNSGYTYNFIGGGRYNNASTEGVVVCGGGFNTSSNFYSSVLGGNGNTSSGRGATVAGGYGNTSSGKISAVGGGLYNTSSNYYCTVPGGYRAKASRYGELSHAAGYFTNTGDAQHTTLIARAETLSGNFTVTIASPAVFTKNNHGLKVGDAITLSTTGSLPTGLNTTTTYYVISAGISGNSFRVSTSPGGSAVNTSGSQSGTHSLNVTTILTLNNAILNSTLDRLTLPAETTWAFSIKLSAYNDTDNQGGWWIFRGGIRRNAANGTALIGSLISENGVESSLSTAATNVVADDTNEALQINVTGVAGKSIRWVAVVDISQVSYGTP